MSTAPFDDVVTRHGATVLRVCRSVLTSHDADDAWSETFLAALRAYPELPLGANLEAWLVRIAQRKALDALGLDAGATAPDIKARFKLLVKRHHPDANGGDRSCEDKLREIIQAYNYLKSAKLV